MKLDHDTVHKAVQAIHSGKHTPNHVATMKHVRKFLTNNKSHAWGKSKRLHQAISKVNIPLHAGVITRDNLIDAIIEAVDPKELKRGIEVEKEHGDHDKETDVFKKSDKKSKKGFEKIAKAHLKELPDYYTRLDKMEKKGKKAHGIKEAAGTRAIGTHAMQLTKNTPFHKAIFRHVKRRPFRYKGKTGNIAVAAEHMSKVVRFKHEDLEALINSLLEAKWMQDAVKRPGAFRAKANKSGMSTSAFASKVLSSKGSYDTRTVRQANLARTFSKFRK